MVLQKEEIQLLQQDFRVSQGMSIQSIHVSQLTDPDCCKSYLSRLTTLFRSPSLSVTASQFAKKYTYIVVLPALFAMSIWNKSLRSHIDNCLLEVTQSNRPWHPKLQLIDGTVDYPVDNRIEWRDQVIRSVFAENITLLWEVLHEVSGVSLDVLWENMAIYIFWLYEEKMKNIDPLIREQSIQDFYYLLEGDPALFGLQENPINRYYKPKLFCHKMEQPVRVRQTCCLHYLVHKTGSYCRTCPKKKKCN